MSSIINIPEPVILGGDVEDLEIYYNMLNQESAADQYILDMSNTPFVRTYGVLALFITSRKLAKLSGQPVLLRNLTDEVNEYLHSINFFKVGANWVQCSNTVDQVDEADGPIPNRLELTTITDSKSVELIAERAEAIFSHWLRVSDLHKLVNVLSELCSNVYQHSDDPFGCVLIQKVESKTRGRVEVRLTVGDMGRGIKGSLIAHHGEIGHNTIDYLREAMKGRSARAGRGGLGLRRVEQIVKEVGGYLWLRSETAAILSKGPGQIKEFAGLAYVSGTQVAVEWHAPLPI
jgi:anti-sigma regulatory factor (Ser/Thr protein kinase)